MSVASVKATINGQVYTLNWDEVSQSYKATITAPAKSSYNQTNHYYPVSVTATDNGGNSTTVNDSDPTFGSFLKLQVKEKVAPVITVTYPTAGSHISSSAPTITFTVTDDDSGVDENTIGLTLDEGSAVTTEIQKTPIENGYSCTYTPSSLLDGNHSFVVNASDHDGNAASAVTTAFVVDTVPPVLTIDTPTDNIVTNQDTVTVSGTTNDATSGPVTVKVNDVPVTVEEDGTFTYEFTLSEGENTITIVATDAVGKSTTVVRHVKKDTGAPVFQEITIVPNPVDAGQTYIITVKVTD